MGKREQTLVKQKKKKKKKNENPGFVRNFTKKLMEKFPKFYSALIVIKSMLWFVTTMCILILVAMYTKIAIPPDGVPRGLYFDEALYFVIITSTMIGFGDFRPNPDFNGTVTILWILIGVVTMTKFMYNLLNVVEERRKRKQNVEVMKAAFANKASFALFDEDGDGVISEQEFLVKMLSRLSYVATKM